MLHHIDPYNARGAKWKPSDFVTSAAQTPEYVRLPADAEHVYSDPVLNFYGLARTVYVDAGEAGPFSEVEESAPIWDGQKWIITRTHSPRAITPADVKAEAYRRIIAICPEWKQRNLTAQAVILAEKGRANWTQEELAEWNAGNAIWQSIAKLRNNSDILEKLPEIPYDFQNDLYWS